MTKIMLRRRGSQVLPWGPEDERVLRAFAEDQPIEADVRTPRRLRNHRHFFAAITAAAHHWPEATEPEPDGDTELLRAWLLCKAGWCTKQDFPVSATEAVTELMGNLLADGRHSFVRGGVIGGQPILRLFMPRSIAWDELDEHEFVRLKSNIFDTIHAVIGCSADDLVRGAQEAA